jgi:PTH1 family peptidyl-tRNA hydrolase
MIIIAGLGNPGPEYDYTPHNVGFAVVDELASRLGVRFRRSASGLAQEGGSSGTTRVILLKPQTYMNRSGSAVRAALEFYKGNPAEDLLVICDDVNLPMGYLRFRDSGGAGGQKGLVSIIQVFGGEKIPRLRIGMGGGHPGADVASHVLRKQTGDSRERFVSIVKSAADAVECYVEHGLQVAMNRHNTVKKEKDTGTTGPPGPSS